MEKLPETFGQYFLKEGVVHAMDQLAAAAAAGAAGPAEQPAAAAPAGEEGESSGRRSGQGQHSGRGGAGAQRSRGGREAEAAAAAGAAAAAAAGAGAKTPAGDTLRAALAARAARFKARHFTDAQGRPLGEPRDTAVRSALLPLVAEGRGAAAAAAAWCSFSCALLLRLLCLRSLAIGAPCSAAAAAPPWPQFRPQFATPTNYKPSTEAPPRSLLPFALVQALRPAPCRRLA